MLPMSTASYSWECQAVFGMLPGDYMEPQVWSESVPLLFGFCAALDRFGLSGWRSWQTGDMTSSISRHESHPLCLTTG